MPHVDAWKKVWETVLYFTMSMGLNVFPSLLQQRCFLHRREALHAARPRKAQHTLL